MIGNIKGAIFDMDGTLIDSLMLWDVLWERLGIRYLQKEGFRPSEDVDKAIRTMLLKDGMNMVHDVYGFGKDGMELLTAANEIFRNFYANEVELKPGVLEFLEACRSKGIKMCVASATGPRLLSVAMEHCGIGHYFSRIFSCAEVGKGKDQPDIYQAALEYLGTSPKETCVFEDSAVAIDTAHDMGLLTVAIYDCYNYGQEHMKATADAYVAKSETLMKFV